MANWWEQVTQFQETGTWEPTATVSDPYYASDPKWADIQAQAEAGMYPVPYPGAAEFTPTPSPSSPSGALAESAPAPQGPLGTIPDPSGDYAPGGPPAWVKWVVMGALVAGGVYLWRKR